MADITMCASDCARARYCKRHPDNGTIPTPNRQSWFAPTPDIHGCDRFFAANPTPPHIEGET